MYMYQAIQPDCRVIAVRPYGKRNIFLYHNPVTGVTAQFVEFKVDYDDSGRGRLRDTGTGYMVNFITGEIYQATFQFPGPPKHLIAKENIPKMPEPAERVKPPMLVASTIAGAFIWLAAIFFVLSLLRWLWRFAF